MKTIRMTLSIVLAAMSILPMRAITINFPDARFAEIVVNKYDQNGDGELSSQEAAAATGELNVSFKNIRSLEGIQYFKNITKLNCYGNNISELDVSRNTNLVELRCGKNKLSTLDLSKNTKLTMVSCYDNKLTKLVLPVNTKLTQLDCHSNKLSKLVFAEGTSIANLDCSRNELQQLDLTNVTDLGLLKCQNNKLQNIDLSKSFDLKMIFCQNNRLSTLNITRTSYGEYGNKIIASGQTSDGKNAITINIKGTQNQLDFYEAHNKNLKNSDGSLQNEGVNFE